MVVQGLDPGHVYEFRVIAVDGVFETASTIQEVHTYATLPTAADRGGVMLASSGWFIGRSTETLAASGIQLEPSSEVFMKIRLFTLL